MSREHFGGLNMKTAFPRYTQLSNTKDGIQIYNASNGLLNSSIGKIGSADNYIPCLAAFTEDGSGVVVVLKCWRHTYLKAEMKVSYQIQRFNLVKQRRQICPTT